jgi:hypothetical protein
MEDSHLRKTHPWRFQDEWEWELGPVENAVTFSIEIGEDGCHTLVVHARPSGPMFGVMADYANSVADYILANPEYYGLCKSEALDRKNQSD